MYGLAQGITQGLQMAQQGMVQAEEIKNRRSEMQMREKQFSQQMQLGQVNIDKSGQELEALKLQMAEFKKEKAKEDTFKALDAFEHSGDTKYLNLAKQNPIIADLFNKQGIAGFMTPAELSEEKKQTLGLTEELMNDPSKRIVIATKADGSLVATDLMATYAMTGYLDRMDSKKLKEIEQRSQAAKLKEQEVQAKTSELKFEDMEKYLAANPNATLADYVKSQDKSKTAIEQNAEYIRANMGEEAYKEYLKKQAGMQEKEYAAIETKEYEIAQLEDIKTEAGVDNLYDVDVNKLSSRNKTVLRIKAREEAKQTSIKDDVMHIAGITKAANRLDIGKLDKATGIIDATVKTSMDVLGMDLDDDVLINSSNYALITNTFIRIAFGTQVTGNEMDRMKKQLGTEFRADKTVRMKLAETLDNAAASYSTYKTTAPALYAVEIKERVERLQAVADELRNGTSEERGKDKKQKLETHEYEGKTFYKDTASGTWKELK